jgi:hypothetical protein
VKPVLNESDGDTGAVEPSAEGMATRAGVQDAWRKLVQPVADETPEQRECRHAVARFNQWLQFYSRLTDPRDMKQRAFSLADCDWNGRYSAGVTVTFRGGSDVRLALVCGCDCGVVEDSGGAAERNSERVSRLSSVELVNRVLSDFFAKNRVIAASGQMGIGIFRPSGLPESSGGNHDFDSEHVWNAIETGGASVMIIDGKTIMYDRKDRVAQIFRHLFQPCTVEEADQYVRHTIDDLFSTYLHVLAETVMDRTGFSSEVVLYAAGRMAQEKLCKVKKTSDGIEIIRV